MSSVVTARGAVQADTGRTIDLVGRTGFLPATNLRFGRQMVGKFAIFTALAPSQDWANRQFCIQKMAERGRFELPVACTTPLFEFWDWRFKGCRGVPESAVLNTNFGVWRVTECLWITAGAAILVGTRSVREGSALIPLRSLLESHARTPLCLDRPQGGDCIPKSFLARNEPGDVFRVTRLITDQSRVIQGNPRCFSFWEIFP